MMLKNLTQSSKFSNSKFSTLNYKASSFAKTTLAPTTTSLRTSPFLQVQRRAYGVEEFKGDDEATKQDRSRIADALAVKKHEVKENSEGEVQKLGDPKKASPKSKPSVDFGDNYNLPHPIWHNEYINNVKNEHRPVENFTDKFAKKTIDLIKFNFDIVSGWAFGKPTVNKALTRVVFLESLAGVPGSVAGVLRHLQSLRRMKRDNGWIHTLFEEAENERMHLLIYMNCMKPGRLFRSIVWLSQGVFFNFFFIAYLVNPVFCHRLVGYLEEGAVKTYGQIMDEVENGELKEWKTTPAPEIAKTYWKMAEDATMLDVLAVTRADEAHHRDVNHAFAGLQADAPNPYQPGH